MKVPFTWSEILADFMVIDIILDRNPIRLLMV